MKSAPARKPGKRIRRMPSQEAVGVREPAGKDAKECHRHLPGFLEHLQKILPVDREAMRALYCNHARRTRAFPQDAELAKNFARCEFTEKHLYGTVEH